ncbi:MAG: hypothetical protein ACK5MT_18235 [Actinomycetales bacterium]
MMNFNVELHVARGHTVKAVVYDGKALLPVDADVEGGDHLTRTLPNGKTQVLVVTKVTVMQSPFGGTFDHTEADTITLSEYERRKSSEAATRNYHFNATNMQVATGDRTTQNMTVDQTADQVVQSMEGLLEMLTSLGLITSPEEAAQRLQEATSEVQDPEARTGATERFRDWVIECVKQGGSAPVVAAVTTLMNAVIHDAEQMVRALGSG